MEVSIERLLRNGEILMLKVETSGGHKVVTLIKLCTKL